jgi:hypothetical protein
MDGTPRTRAPRRARQSAPAELEAAPAPAPAAVADDVELLEDHTRPITHHRTGRRLGVSLPGAVLGAFLITAMALGASLRTATVPGSGVGGTGATVGLEDGDAPDGDKPGAEEPKDEPGAEEPGDEPKDEPGAEEPGDEPGDTPAEEDPKPEPPAVKEIEIGVGLNEGRVIVEWSTCEVDGFVAYKVVRSTDSTVTYPRAANDTTVGIIEAAGTTRFVDTRAQAGKKLFYRVFAIASREGGQFVACRSGVEDVTTPRPEPDPTKEPTPKPTPKPEIGTLALSVSIREGVPYVDWSECKVDGDFIYKVVRSKDAKVAWPLGDYDSVVAAVGPDGTTAVFDEEIDPGKKVFYRVFCLRALEEGYKVLAASPVKGIQTPAPEPEPLPDPSVMGFEVAVTGEGVVLHWQQCTAGQFAFYKVIRSHNPNPSYLPGTDGSQVVAVFENSAITEFVDESADAGTWFYRVQSIGYADGHKFLLGQTPVRSITVE